MSKQSPDGQDGDYYNETLSNPPAGEIIRALRLCNILPYVVEEGREGMLNPETGYRRAISNKLR